ncbi:3-carboxymuconate cyclase [Heterostelium album PN500]|uniref:3-carboxymuconate cyclase n=1 Tax=Heterostelium pallidum (strain ATCC 26659 / Pp 5 / PN500) TaxID=670386 RepID=D3BJR2_HETP5|nr:3-carboxymuconate cyclase [Heterostelium album PN500]EFA78142.1 3-carboxymuconate cyclase [Heterostelium album PN500]|eukprot:XP_020430268.1 3-carboxymuconate cyclase [Heterostelium album PN500]
MSEILAYIGTYHPNGEGVYLYSMNKETGALTRKSVVSTKESPAQLVIDSVNNKLYTASEITNYQGGNNGSVISYSIDVASGSLTFIQECDALGGLPCHLSLDNENKHLMVANYACGSVAVFPIGSDGAVSKSSSFFKTAGDVGPLRAEGSQPGSFSISGHDGVHAHWIGTDRSGRYAFHTDLGQDRIYQWKYSNGNLAPNSPAWIPAASKGCGPRHLVFHPSKDYAYIINEESSTVTHYDFDSNTGLLKERSTISNFEAGYKGSSFGSGIVVSPCGKRIYALNRLRNTITHFDISEQDGSLSFIEEVWTRGDFPRALTIDPTHRFLYVLNQRSDNITYFTIDQQSGKLQFNNNYIDVGSPSQLNHEHINYFLILERVYKSFP